MRTILLSAVLLVSFACSGSGHQSALPGARESPVAKLPNPVSAPSATMGQGQPQGQAAPAEPAVPDGPRQVNFTDVKFRITLPGPDWQVKVTEQGVQVLNEKVLGMVSLHIGEDTRPLQEIAEAEKATMQATGKFTVSEVKTFADPERAAFMAMLPLDDGSKVVMTGVFMRNPGNPTTQTLVLFGLWIEGKDAVREEVLGIIGSVQPMQ